MISLFIGAIRCAQIARKIIDLECPDEILMPETAISEPPYALAYELLPQAVEHLATLDGVKIKKMKMSSRVRSRAVVSSVKNKSVSLIFGVATEIFIAYSSFLSKNSKTKHGKTAIMYSCVSERHLIDRAIGKDASVNLRLYPVCLPNYLFKSFLKPKPLKARFRRLWSELTLNEPFKAELMYRGVSLFEILHNELQMLFTDLFPTLVTFIMWADKNTQRLSPDLLVLMEDTSPLHKTLCNVAKRRGIPILMLQHGAYSDWSPFPAMPFCSDKQAVWGVIPQEQHILRGKSRESQIVTGNYKFDPIARGYSVEKERICRKLGITPLKRTVVVATTWYANIFVGYTPESYERCISWTLEALKHFPQEQVVVKLHPTYHQAYRDIVAAIVNEVGIHAPITKDYLRELLSICDLLICENSTVGLEAMILGKPVVTLKIDDLPQIPYERYGAALSVSTAEEIVPAIDAALNNTEVRERLLRNARQFVQDYAYLQDGNASKRVAELMMDMARGS